MAGGAAAPAAAPAAVPAPAASPYVLPLTICPLFQGIFKHYNADQSGFINSYEMRNAVNDAGSEQAAAPVVIGATETNPGFGINSPLNLLVAAQSRVLCPAQASVSTTSCTTSSPCATPTRT